MCMGRERESIIQDWQHTAVAQGWLFIITHTWLETVVSALQAPERSVVLSAAKWIFPLNPNRTFFWKKNEHWENETGLNSANSSGWKKSWRECSYNAKPVFLTYSKLNIWLVYSFFLFVCFVFYFLEVHLARDFQLRKKKTALFLNDYSVLQVLVWVLRGRAPCFVFGCLLSPVNQNCSMHPAPVLTIFPGSSRRKRTQQ